MANRIGGEHEIGIEYFMKVRAYISIGVVNGVLEIERVRAVN